MPGGLFMAMVETGERVSLTALGDSLSYGYLVRRGYLDHLRDLLLERAPDARLHIRNRGICGDTADGGLRRLDWEVLDEPADLVLVQFGLNDAFSGISAETFGRNVTTIIERVRSAMPAAQVILVPPPPLRDPEDDEYVEPWRRAMAQAAPPEVPVAPVKAHWPEDGPLWLGDGVHPSEAGYLCIARAVFAALTKDED